MNCSDIPIDAVGNPNTDIGVVESQNGLGGSPFVFADLTHAGWLPGGILPPNVIAVTFTSSSSTVSGIRPTLTTTARPIPPSARSLYNDAFVWQINANIDVETVALHEAGHGLSQGHFGKGFVTSSTGQVHFAPRAVMNATYSGVQQTIDQSDVGGHCSIWASWPNN